MLLGLARAGDAAPWSQTVAPTAPSRQLTNALYGEMPTSVSRDGKTVLIRDPDRGELRVLSLEGEPAVRAFTGTGIRAPEISPEADDPTGWKAAEALIGFIADALADMAEHHDHYLYGQPKT